MTRQNVRAKARGLGAELADLRAQAGLTLREVADLLDWSAPTLSRVENGMRDTTSEEVAALLVVYKITGAKKDRLVHMARTIDQPGWWETSAGDLPGQLVALRAFEAKAVKITTFGLTFVPGLLQTEDYTRSLMEAVGVPDNGAIDKWTAVRLGRQEILSRRNPPVLHTIIDEAALNRTFGGPGVMAEQARHIVQMAAKPNVTVQVLRRPDHPAVSGSFHILEFPPPAKAFVHLEHFGSSLFLDEPEDVGSFQTLTATVTGMALDRTSSQDFMAHLARRYEAEAEGHRDGRGYPGVAHVQLQREDRMRRSGSTAVRGRRT